MPQDMSRAFLITLDRLAFMTVLVISRMMDSNRFDRTASRIGSKLAKCLLGLFRSTAPLSPISLPPLLPHPLGRPPPDVRDQYKHLSITAAVITRVLLPVPPGIGGSDMIERPAS